MSAGPPLLEVDDLTVHFPAPGGGALGLKRRSVKALNGVSLTLQAGETLGIVGESGSGKSTLGRAILGLGPITSGHVALSGEDITEGGRAARARLRRETAMVFQDPFNALNPRMTVSQTLREVLHVHGRLPRGGEAEAVAALLRRVGLQPDLASRRPAALSGGQCQRVGIARALAVEPRLIVADECVAALDVSIQGQIINLFIEMKAQRDLAMIFIAHDLSIVRRLCDRVAVMYLGRLVEEGPVERVFAAPRHPYTAALLRAVPQIDPDRRLPEDPVRGEPPSPIDLPPGCPFHPRCPSAQAQCAADPPPTLRREAGHAWACILDPQVSLVTAA